MNKKLIVIIGFLIILALGIGWFYLMRGKVVTQLTVSGTIEAREVEVGSKIGGRILKLKVEEGNQVKEGVVVALIEAKELQASLKQAEAGVTAATIQYQHASKEYLRIKRLLGEGMVSKSQFDAVEAAFKSAEAKLAQVQAAKEVIQIQLGEATVKAPSEGVVMVKAVEEGELVSPGHPIVTLADLRVVKLTVYVPEKEVGRISLGQLVKVTVDSYPKEFFEGKVTHIAEEAEFTPKNIQTKEERITQVFAVDIQIPNPQFKLKPGMPADAEIIL